MTPSQSAFEQFIGAPQPVFLCRVSGEPEEIVVPLRHIVGAPAPARALDEIRQRFGAHADQLLEFYARHDGFELYADEHGDTAGVVLYPVGEWTTATEGFRVWFPQNSSTDPSEDPDHVRSGIAIGSVPNSGNYFVMPTDGPSAGQVFYVPHGSWYDEEFATDFDGLLRRVIESPVKLLTEELGCYARYENGTSIPELYAPDPKTLAAARDAIEKAEAPRTVYRADDEDWT